jgi:aryl-alcohol dehydrogenase-like predicted oxidoreductase
LLGGNIGPDVRFAADDWRSKSSVFRGEAFERNLLAVAELAHLAAEDLGITLPQLAVAWTLTNPAEHVAIVGTRNPDHVEEALVAADINLDAAVLARIDHIMAHATPVAGSSPETV